MDFADLFKLQDDNYLLDLKANNKALSAFRHHYQDDFNILKSKGSESFDEAAIEEHSLLGTHGHTDSASKLAAIRSDLVVAQMACAEQGKPILDNKAVCFSFSSHANKKAEFIGAFAVKRRVDLDFFLKKFADYLSDLPPLLQESWGFEKYVTKLGYSKWLKAEHNYYDLELLDNPINEYRNRVIVHWNAPIAWSQNHLNHPVEEIRAKGFVRDFPGYYDVILDFVELQAIMKSPDGNPEWKSKLSAVTGIYLIMDTHSGKQYIGSAYSKDGGIWSRWKAYAKDGHGGNQMLRELVGDKPSNANKFRFSILRVMESGARARDVIEAESSLKQKLGSRAFGYNLN